jgi:hypothetical protein
MHTIIYERSRQFNGIGLLNFEAQKMLKISIPLKFEASIALNACKARSLEGGNDKLIYDEKPLTIKF